MSIVIALYRVMNYLFALLSLGLNFAFTHIRNDKEIIRPGLTMITAIVISILWSEKWRKVRATRWILAILHIIYLIGLISFTRQHNPFSILVNSFVSVLGVLTVGLVVHLFRNSGQSVGGSDG